MSNPSLRPTTAPLTAACRTFQRKKLLRQYSSEGAQVSEATTVSTPRPIALGASLRRIALSQRLEKATVGSDGSTISLLLFDGSSMMALTFRFCLRLIAQPDIARSMTFRAFSFETSRAASLIVLVCRPSSQSKLLTTEAGSSSGFVVATTPNNTYRNANLIKLYAKFVGGKNRKGNHALPTVVGSNFVQNTNRRLALGKLSLLNGFSVLVAHRHPLVHPRQKRVDRGRLENLDGDAKGNQVRIVVHVRVTQNAIH